MKNYNPMEIEPKWQKRWEEAGWPKARDFDEKRPKFYALVEFPYPSGEGLHIGHAFTNTILDVYARKKRMSGFNVLYPMGWDAFGLPTENYAIRTGIHPKIATKQNTDRFREQMKRLAFAYNWDREINTTDPAYYRWTQWIFLQLFKHGLAYKKKMPINWCPSCKIGLANEEVVNGECERCGAPVEQRNLAQWLLRITAYADRLADELDLVDFPESVEAAQRNWIGRSEGVEEYWQVGGMDLKLSTFTTWLHTTWGATFIVIAPEHPIIEDLVKGTEYEKGAKEFCEAVIREKMADPISVEKEKKGFFTGRYAINHLTGEKIPIFVANFAVMEYGTGIVKGAPAHDLRDFEFAKKYDLEIRPVIMPEGGEELSGEGMTEPYIGEGLMINAGPFTGMGTKKAREAITEHVIKAGNGKRVVNYHLRDWIFSRQHYWGEPIPMVYCEKCAEKGITWWDTKEAQNSKFETQNHNSKFKTLEIEDEFKKQLAGWFPVAEKDLPVELPEVEKYRPTGTGESPLAAITDWVETTCPYCGGAARRETDTMPNWAGSSWYFLAYTFWHKLGTQNSKVKTQKLNTESVFLKHKDSINYWMPVDQYIGGIEHATMHLIYSRFFNKVLYDSGLIKFKEPFTKYFPHGVVNLNGQKMSKSRGNIVNPSEIYDKYGADTLRLYILFMGPAGSLVDWNDSGVEGANRFLSRVRRLVIDNTRLINAAGERGDISGNLTKLEKELYKKLHQTIKKVTVDILDRFNFNTAISAIMELVNLMYKYNEEAEDSKKNIALLEELTEKLLILLSPVTPFITEELWSRMGNKGSIHRVPWPEHDEEIAKEELITIVFQVNGKIRDKKNLPAGISAEVIEDYALNSERIKKFIGSREIIKKIVIPNKLVNIVVKS